MADTITKKRELEKLSSKCRYCNGTGLKYFIRFKRKGSFYSAETRKRAFDLYSEGMTLREIGRRMGIKHPQSVKSLIDSYLKILPKEMVSDLL